MVVERKKKTIDGMDKEILRSMRETERQLTSRQIAMGVSISGSAILPRLNNLKSQGLIKTKSGGMRTFDREIKGKKIKIKAPSKRFWMLDLKPEKKKKR